MAKLTTHTDFAPNASTMRRRIVERAIHDTRDDTLTHAIEICRDINTFGGGAADCVLALTLFRERLIAIFKEDPSETP